MTLSIVMPVLNEAADIAAALSALAPYRARGVELIVVDGGSRDGDRRAWRVRSPTACCRRRAGARRK